MSDGDMLRYAAEIAEHRRDPYSLIEETVENSAKKPNQTKPTLALLAQIAPPAAAESVATLPTARFLAAGGHTWFDYPFHYVLKILEYDYGYNVESTTHKGDSIAKIA